jgi:hypothetical protein
VPLNCCTSSLCIKVWQRLHQEGLGGHRLARGTGYAALRASAHRGVYCAWNQGCQGARFSCVHVGLLRLPLSMKLKLLSAISCLTYRHAPILILSARAHPRDGCSDRMSGSRRNTWYRRNAVSVHGPTLGRVCIHQICEQSLRYLPLQLPLFAHHCYQHFRYGLTGIGAASIK